MASDSRKLLNAMLRIRLVEERIAALYAEGGMRCPVHLCIGQEAVAAGVSVHLSAADYAVSGHRSHGHYLAKGGALEPMLAELYGKADGCSGGKGGSMHLIDLSCGFLGATPIVASTIPIGVGSALALEMKKKKNLCVVYFGEGATEEGAFHEAANFAALKKLPVLFVCENNFYSVYTPLAPRQPKGREVYKLAAAYGMKSFKRDGNDVEGVSRLAKKAVDSIRSGGGPVFLEFETYRFLEHCGPNDDDGLGYRPKGELAKWKKLCPVERYEAFLKKKGVLSAAAIEKMRTAIDAEIDAAVDVAKKSPFPAKSELQKGVYAEKGEQ